MKINIDKLIEVYGLSQDNWGDLPYFQGGYINYGYWKNIQLNDLDIISVEQRIQSSVDLYKEIISDLNLSQEDSVLEVGCGRGIGIANVLSWFPNKEIYALDINPNQIERAKVNVKKMAPQLKDIIFINRNVEDTGLPTSSIDKAYSVEAAQHFGSIENFAVEMKRLLKPGGQLTFATYFPKSSGYNKELKEILPLIHEKLENITPVDKICAIFLKAGFTNASYRSIGKDVFHDYSRWLKQVNSNFWSLNYYKAYKLGYIDYYIFTIK